MVHFMRNVLVRVSKTAQAMVAATVRTIFEQPDRASAAAQLRHVCDVLSTRFPAVVQLVEDAESEILTFYDFPVEHRRQVYSTNPLERLNKEVKRRTDVVGIFPNDRAVIRLVGAILTVRTQSSIRGVRRLERRTAARLGWTAEWDDMANFQRVLPHNNALDQQFQDRALLGEGGVLEPAADPLAETREVAEHGQVLTPLSQLLQADDLRLVGVEQALLLPSEALDARR
jgi:hypothetical protein